VKGNASLKPVENGVLKLIMVMELVYRPVEIPFILIINVFAHIFVRPRTQFSQFDVL
jgi:hypothetical protein